MVFGMLCGGMSVVWADEVLLSNGRTLEGIVVAETGTSITLQVMADGFLTLAAREVQHVDVANEVARKDLQARWTVRAEKLRAQRQKQLVFEDAQRRQGLVRYRGQWITQQELDQIRSDAARAREARQHQQVQPATPELSPVKTRTVIRRIYLPFHVNGHHGCGVGGHVAGKRFRLAKAPTRPLPDTGHVCVSHGTHHPTVCHRAARRQGGVVPVPLADGHTHVSQ